MNTPTNIVYVFIAHVHGCRINLSSVTKKLFVHHTHITAFPALNPRYDPVNNTIIKYCSINSGVYELYYDPKSKIKYIV